ncbi:hypothetical protein F66182_4511 [Fusarium sp. NRRL 66182]|nr:hypothetical protein F66182_4511 [Fusarium sp. NRRL 66182]
MIPNALRNSGSSIEKTVEQAFARAIVKHPLFTAGRLNDDSKRPCWARLRRIDLDNHIEWRTVPSSDDYDQILQDAMLWQVNNRYTHLETRPQWRSVILKPTESKFIDVVFAWDHTAGDGKSGRIFHDSLLASLTSQESGEEAILIKDRSFEVPTKPFTPALECLVKFPLTFNYVLTEAKRNLTISSNKAISPQEATWAPIQPKPCETRFTTITVQESLFKPILNKCRQENTTLTALLHTLVLVSLATRLPETKAQAFQNGTPICMRQFYRPERSGLNMEETVVNCVAYWPYIFDRHSVAKIRKQLKDVEARPEASSEMEATVWSLARESRQGLSEKLKQGTKNDAIGLTKFIRDWRSFLADVSKTRTYSWEVSNLGVIKGAVPNKEETGGRCWEIERAIFTQAAPVAGAALTFSLISVKDKALTVTCCWQVGVVQEDLVQALSSDIETWLSRLGSIGHLDFVKRDNRGK